MKGKQITKLEQVVKLSKAGKAIYHSRWGRSVAASFIVGIPLTVVAGYIRMGWLYHYKPIKKAKNECK